MRSKVANVASRAALSLVLCGAALPAAAQSIFGYELRPDVRESLEEARARADRAARQATNESLRRLRDRPPPPQSAPAFAAVIRFSRDEARNAGARRAPASVRRALEPYFSRATLEQVRWNLPGRRAELGSLVAGWYFNEGAVTLDDVIVFSDNRLAQDVWFWAHEMVHVEQYRRLGVDGFARAYMKDWRVLEREATAKANRIRAELARSGGNRS